MPSGGIVIIVNVTQVTAINVTARHVFMDCKVASVGTVRRVVAPWRVQPSVNAGAITLLADSQREALKTERCKSRHDGWCMVTLTDLGGCLQTRLGVHDTRERGFECRLACDADCSAPICS